MATKDTCLDGAVRVGKLNLSQMTGNVLIVPRSNLPARKEWQDTKKNTSKVTGQMVSGFGVV